MKNEYKINGNIAIIWMNRKNGEVIGTVIDADMVEKANEFKGTWYPHWNPHTDSYYVYGAIRRNGKRDSLRLHRWLLNEPEGLVVDHINHDSLDNRIDNLRAVTNAENIRNRKGLQTNNKSGVSGVYWYKSRNKWMAQFVYNRKRVFVGYFDTIEDAEIAIMEKQKEYKEEK